MRSHPPTENIYFAERCAAWFMVLTVSDFAIAPSSDQSTTDSVATHSAREDYLGRQYL